MAKFLVTLEAIYFVILNCIKKPKPLQSSDLFAVFLKNARKDFDKKKNTVSAEAFRPDPVKNRLETSLYRVSTLQKEDIFDLGERWTRINFWPRKSGKSSVKAYAQIKNYNITPPLIAVLEPSPHPEHVNLIQWPDTESQIELKMFELALNSSLVIKPSNPS